MSAPKGKLCANIHGSDFKSHLLTLFCFVRGSEFFPFLLDSVKNSHYPHCITLKKRLHPTDVNEKMSLRRHTLSPDQHFAQEWKLVGPTVVIHQLFTTLTYIL